MRSQVSRVAAAVILVAAVAVVALWFHGSGAAPAFADFLQPILEAKTVKYRMTMEMKGPPALTTTSEHMVLDGFRSRSETVTSAAFKTVQITDWRRGKSLSLNPTTKEATILEYTNVPKNVANDPSSWFCLLQVARDNKNKKLKSQPLGEKRIGGRRAVGFRLSSDTGLAMDLWGDPQTGTPVRVEMTAGMEGQMKATLSDFAFNIPMDESLFSLEPPAGYSVRTEEADVSPAEERDLIEMFREYAKLCRGIFPKSLNAMAITSVYCRKHNSRYMCETFSSATKSMEGKTFEEKRENLEKQMDELADMAMDYALKGQPTDAAGQKSMQKFQEQMRKVAIQGAIQAVWESIVPANWRPSEDVRRKFEKLLREIMEQAANGKQAEKQSEQIHKFIFQVGWESLAPAGWKTNEEKRRQFEALMLKRMPGKANEKQKFDAEFRETLGEEMLKGVKDWETAMEKAAIAKQAQLRKTEEARQAQDREFMEGQRRVQRGLHFAIRLAPSAEAHYVGQGVSLGAIDTPIFWYRRQETKKYRVIYADLSVRDADSPPAPCPRHSP